MLPRKIEWSKEKGKLLALQLQGYWAKDVWDAKECPLGEPTNFKYKSRYLEFTCAFPSINTEVKYACWQKLEREEWSVNNLWFNGTAIRRLNQWLTDVAFGNSSLIGKSLEQWLLSLRTYIISNPDWPQKAYLSTPHLDRSQSLRQYQAQHPYITVFRQIYLIVEEAYDERSEYEKDIWDIRKLGIMTHPSRSHHILNFTKIYQPWLREVTKKFIRFTLSVHSYSEASNRLFSLRSFSEFLRRYDPLIEAGQIDRPLIIEYLSYLAADGRSPNTHIKAISHLRQLLEIAAREGWMDVPDKRLIYSEDFPKTVVAQPRYIPQEVLDQLNLYIDELPPHIKRMALIIQECGMRIGELSRMPIDCLMQDTQGDWFLRYYQYKMKKEHSIPISNEIAAVIDEQRQEVIEQCGLQFPYLFPSPHNWKKGRPITQDTFATALNTLAHEKDIRDSSGKLWRFQSHQFRHSLGCRMTNLNVPITVIMRYLGHESPEMTIRYAHIHDQTLKKEFLKFQDKLVDVTGKAIGLNQLEAEIAQGIDPNTIDEQWLKRNILAQALPNGLCALPVVQGHCPHGANKCLTGADGKGCPHFKTDIRYLDKHKEHLGRTQEIISWAQENSQSRRSGEILKENLPVQSNLKRIIDSLEEDKDDEPQ